MIVADKRREGGRLRNRSYQIVRIADREADYGWSRKRNQDVLIVRVPRQRCTLGAYEFAQTRILGRNGGSGRTIDQRLKDDALAVINVGIVGRVCGDGAERQAQRESESATN